MKKVLAAVLAASMVASPMVFAEELTKDNFGTQFKDNVNAGTQQSEIDNIINGLLGVDEATVEVLSNIQIKLSDSADYGDTKITQTVSSSNYPTFDFLNKLDMSSVRESVQKYAVLASQIQSIVSPDFYDQIMASPITGEFDITVKYPKNLSVNSAYTVDNKDSYGFKNVQSGKVNTIFKETKRTLTTEGSNNVLKITMAVDEDYVDPAYSGKAYYTKGLTCSALIANLNDYLVDMEFEVLAAQPKAAGDYKITGDVTGSVAVGKLKDQDYKATQDNATAGDSSGLNESFKIVKKSTSTGGSGGGGGSIMIRPETPTVPEDNKTFASDNKKAYITGYPDGTVRPNANITREEVATALYRLLSDEKKAEIDADLNIFTDVAADRWSNKSISSMAKGGYIGGYEDKTFRPENPITRAEFATIAIRFFNETEISGSEYNYSDINGHWAASSIYAASVRGVMKGYEDGTFRPDDYITRAEAMTVINRMINRTSGDLADNATTWIDVDNNDWYYSDVMAATNDVK